MSRDLYVSLSGACSAWAEMERVANDLANVNTTGYRGERLTYKAAGTRGNEVYATLDGASIDGRVGPRQIDGNPLHVALDGQGYLALDDGKGGTALTRDGHLDVKDGFLVQDGSRVLGTTGPIAIPPGASPSIDPDGTVRSGDEVYGKMRIVDGPAKAAGGARFLPTGALTASATRVSSGVLEGSNVDPTTTMVELIQAGRAFEMFQKAMQTSDELDDRLNRMGGSR